MNVMQIHLPQQDPGLPKLGTLFRQPNRDGQRAMPVNVMQIHLPQQDPGLPKLGTLFRQPNRDGQRAM
ncbi:hypothetical protein GJ26_18975, partial [Vibrio cholerae]